MRVEVSNLAAANFNFPSILSSKSLFAGKSNGSPTESQSRSIREQKSLRVNLEKTQCSRKREVHSSTHRVNLDKKLSAVAVWERREEEKKEEWKRWRHHSNHQSYACEKYIIKNHLNNYCKNINIDVELKNIDFRWSKKRWSTMGCPHLKKNNY